MSINTNQSTDTLVPSTGELTTTGDLSVSGTIDANDFRRNGVAFSGIATRGSATISGGGITVLRSSALTTSTYLLTRVETGGAPGAPGYLYVSAINNGVSFTISSTNSSDSATVHYIIVN